MTSSRERREDSAADRGYERSDARVLPLMIFGGVLALLVAGSLGVSAWLSKRLTDDVRAEQQPANPMRDALARPTDPALQAVPSAALAEKRAWEERVLTSTEWVDPLNRVVRIPISEALELALEEGFPTRDLAREGD